MWGARDWLRRLTPRVSAGANQGPGLAKYMRERSRTYETTANCDNIVNALRETHNLRFNEDKRNLGTNEK